jgi:WD40 repeat protein/serine/threonine protein kinase
MPFMSGARPSAGEKERDIFLGALEEPAPQERAAYLDRACGDDRALRAAVEALLENHKEDAFLETPVVEAPRAEAGRGPGGTAIVDVLTEKAGDRIGRYKLLQEIGEGGCGTVYMAEQVEPVRRRVALKIIKLGMDTKSVIARFEAERQALALMDHPNIAKVLDAGATETGRPFFVMELVRGVRITDYCDQNNLPTRERLDLFIKVCQAIQHAHQKGIIHRDIKPSNILVTLHDGTPVPKIIDFGIAKATTDQRLTDKTLFTAFQQFIGTPAYMSPEQAEMSGLDIDTRTDVYSLGVLLYELLTGKTPFDAKELASSGLDEMRRTIREREPVRPSTRLRTMLDAELTTTAKHQQAEPARLAGLVRGDLDWIVMKALEKDRMRRFQTASELAMDVQRYLDNDPVLARPPTNLYRLQKLLRKHRGAFAAAAGIAVTLIAGAGISIRQAVRATRAEQGALTSQKQETHQRQQAEQERERAEREKASARLNEYVADINLAQQSMKDGNLGRAVQLLNKHRPGPGAPDLRGFEWRYLWQLCQGDKHESFPNQDGPVQSIAFSPGGDELAISAGDQTSIWKFGTKTWITNLSRGAGSMTFPPTAGRPAGPPKGFRFPGAGTLAFLPDGRTLITASPATVRVWNTVNWSGQRSLPDAGGPVAISPDGSRLAVMKGDFMNKRSVAIWDTSAWTELRVLPNVSGLMAFSSDGKMLATETKAGITLWMTEGVGSEVVLQNSTNIFIGGGLGFLTPRTVAFSPDGRFVVAARNMISERGVFVLSIWDAKSGKEIGVMPDDPGHIEHIGAISCLAFSPDGRTLATASLDYSIRLWDFATRKRFATLHGHLSEVWNLAFSPDGQTLVSGAKDGGVKVWATRRDQKEDVLAGASMPLAFSKDSRTLVALKQKDTVMFFDLKRGEPDQQIQLEVPRGRSGPRDWFGPPTAISEDLRSLVQGLGDGTVKVWNTETGDTSTLKASDHPLDLVALSPDGRYLVTGEHDQIPRLWDLRTGTNSFLSIEAPRVLFSPDGRSLAVLNPRENSVQVLNLEMRTVRTNLVIDIQPGFSAAFSPDGRMLAVTYQDDSIRLWDVPTGALIGTCSGHKQPVFSVAFSPDGKTLASASDDSTLKLWNVATQQELLTVRRLGGAMAGLMFSPDGRLLVGGSSPFSQTSGLRFFRAPLLSEIDVATQPSAGN